MAGTVAQVGNVVWPRAFQPDDATLVEAMRNGDGRAKHMFFDRHAPHVARVLARILGVDDDLADLVHDVFVMALRDLGRLEDPSALRAWLTAIAVNIARGHIRRRVRRRWLRFFAPEDLPETPSVSSDDEVREATRATYAVLARLPEDERIAFALRVIDAMELTEVASACGVSLATIKRRLSRAERAFLAGARAYPVLTGWLEGGSRWGTK